MGQGQSSSNDHNQSPALQQLQTLAASTGALPVLQQAFSRLSDPQTHSVPIPRLQERFDLRFQEVDCDHEPVVTEFNRLLSHVGSAVVDLFFYAGKNGVDWCMFLKGYTNFCARTVASTVCINLFRLYSLICSRAGIPIDLKFVSCDEDFKISGSLSPKDTIFVLWVCWAFSWDSKTFSLSTGKEKRVCTLPDVSHLVLSCIESCIEGDQKIDLWDSSVADMNFILPAAKVYAWTSTALPNLADCFVQFFHGRLCFIPTNEELESSIPQFLESPVTQTALFTPARAWSISLTLRGPVREEMPKICFSENLDKMNENLLYRSSVHGKGLNRFWANVVGYNGPLLLIISAYVDKSNNQSWIIGALTNQGFENKDSFYGSSGSLYALSPVFHAILSSGRERNFVYSHLHPTSRSYEPHPKPVGVAFGGSIGNERIFLDEDFNTITIRHHFTDKTYQHGTLFPNQGLLVTEARVQEVEVWGLGGKKAQEVQDAYKKREQLFTEQRRKVDLRTFTNWEDSPEKIMMDMVTDPNAVRREDR